MILLVHMLFGAAIGSLAKNIYLAIILAFLGHYLLDFIPHIDYPLKNIEKKQWQKVLPDFLKIALDLGLGLLLIFLFSKNQPIIYVCAFFALVPDGITFLSLAFPNKIFEPLQKFHIEKAHFFKNNPSTSSGQIKISNFWRILSQVAVVFISILLLVAS